MIIRFSSEKKLRKSYIQRVYNVRKILFLKLFNVFFDAEKQNKGRCKILKQIVQYLDGHS